jgi:hypothetical protein
MTAPAPILKPLGDLLAAEERAAAALTATPVIWRVCSWCHRCVGFDVARYPNRAGDITHTACPTCKKDFLASNAARPSCRSNAAEVRR